MTKIRTTISGEAFVYKNLWTVAQMEIEQAAREKRGSFYRHLVAMVFAFHTLEAYLNFVGSKLRDDFKKIERSMSFDTKLNTVLDLLGVEPDKGSTAWAAVADLKRLRDQIVHAHTEKVETVIEHDADETPNLNAYQIFDGMVTKESAEQAMRNLEAVIAEMHEAARRKLPDEMWLTREPFGGVSYHASGSSVVA